MAIQTVENPFGALRTVSDYRTFKSDDGDTVAPKTESEFFRANAAINKGEVVEFVAAVAATPLSVQAMATATAGSLFAGVAMGAAAAGEEVQVCTRGFAFVDVAATTAAFGDYIGKPATTAGKANADAVIDATSVLGTAIGICFGAKDANNLAPAMIRQW